METFSALKAFLSFNDNFLKLQSKQEFLVDVHWNSTTNSPLSSTLVLHYVCETLVLLIKNKSVLSSPAAIQEALVLTKMNILKGFKNHKLGMCN